MSNPSLKAELHRMIRSGVSLEGATFMLHNGMIDQTVFGRWLKLWHWSATRLAGRAADLQESYQRRHGWQARDRRIIRVQRAVRFVMCKAVQS